MSEQRVYFIQPEGGGPVKIGIAADVLKRRDQLQVSHPFKLFILAHKPGGPVEEARLHEKLKEDRLNGEWFLHSDAVRAEIEAALIYDQTFTRRPSASQDELDRKYVRERHAAITSEWLRRAFPIALTEAFPDKYKRAFNIARAAKVNDKTAASWLAGRHEPRLEQLTALSRANGVMRLWVFKAFAALSLSKERGISPDEAMALCESDPLLIKAYWFPEMMKTAA